VFYISSDSGDITKTHSGLFFLDTVYKRVSCVKHVRQLITNLLLHCVRCMWSGCVWQVYM